MNPSPLTPGCALDAGRSRGARTGLASIAAIGGVLAASSCCWPLLPFVVGAGLAGGSNFFAAARPYLLGASILLVAYGFYQAWRGRQCRRPPSVAASALLWISTLLVAISLLFPQILANAAANLLAR